MSEEWQAYIKDTRTVCKYGSKCYQKNPEHHQNFKHPPANKKRKGDHNSPAGKRHRPSPKPKRVMSPTKDSHNSPAGNRFKPSPEHVMSPKTEDSTKEKGCDNSVALASTAHDKSNNEGADKTLDSEASTSNQEENFTIKLPETLTYHDKDDHSLFKELFLVDMPDDFFKFYECLLGEQNIEKTLASVNLHLIGPFDLLMGKLPVLDDKELYLIHWRFFYDPPEFQAVLKKKGKSEYHIGYFRDEPNSAPVFMAHSDSAKGCHITPMADNIFGAVYLYLENEKKSSPFISVPCQKLMEKVKKWAESHNYSLEEYNIKKRLAKSLTKTLHGAGIVVPYNKKTELGYRKLVETDDNYSLEEYNIKKRLAKSLTKTLHGAGIVVPYNKKTELGYRKLVETDANLKKLFIKLESSKTQKEKDNVLSELQPVITYASIAVDECDFGTGLECGIDLFCSGIKDLQQSALATLQPVYSLLNREAFSKIIEAHIKYRRRGPNMSILSCSKP